MDIGKNAFQLLFHPKSIAVIGASNNEFKPGGRVIKNITSHGYAGKLWAVNPKDSNIQGVPTYPSIDVLPEAPDLAIVGIPARFVLPSVVDLGKKGVKAVIVLSAGFGEKDEEGKAAEQQLVEVAEKYDMILIGPNCSGFLTPTYKGKFAGLIPTLAGAEVDFISGSGATVDYVMENATPRGLSFGIVINLGNSAMYGVEDLVELYDQNYSQQSSKILLLYMESVAKPGKLLRHARSLVRKGCVVIGIKSGVTAAGQRAAASHTGAMASSDTAVGALFEKAGIIRVHSRQELVDAACIVAATKKRISGRKVCIITDAGGPGVMLTDALGRHGLELASLSDSSVQELSQVLPKESSLANPIDALPSRNAQQISDVISILGNNEKDNIDVIAVVLGDSGMSDNMPIFMAIATQMEKSPIPVIPVLSSLVTSREKLAEFCAARKVFFPDEVAMGNALGRVVNTALPVEGEGEPAGYDRQAIADLLLGNTGALPPDLVKGVLDKAGFLLPHQEEIADQAELDATCARVGFPLVMKVVGPLHKTDVGGVALNITDAASALEAFTRLMTIEDARGVLLQPMVKGPEVILGASREADFGHLLMFGLGGIYTEVLKDVSFALAPVSFAESLRMVKRIRSYALLEGARGEAGMDIELLARSVQRLGRLVADFPQINEIDLNPLKGVGEDLYAVDARIILT